MMKDEFDRVQEARLVSLLQTDPKFAKAYLDTEPHDGHTAGNEIERRERHITAVNHAANLLEAANAQPATVSLSEEARQQTKTEIAMQMREPAYLDLNHRDHKAAVDRVAGLYARLNAA
jgi:hypothetical protein